MRWAGSRLAILARVTNHDAPGQARTLLRRAVLAVLTALVAVVALPAVASADTPAAWDDSDHVSGLQYLLILVLIPLGLALLIAVLVTLPSMIHNRGYEPGQSWRGDTEWFGGPTKGVKGADDVTPDQIEQSSQGAGGISGRW